MKRKSKSGNPFGRAKKVIDDVEMPKTPNTFGDAGGFGKMKSGFGNPFAKNSGIGNGSNNPFSMESGLGRKLGGGLGSEKSIGKRAKNDFKKFNKQPKPFDMFGGMKMDDD